MTGATFGEFGSEVDIDLLADYIGGALDGTPGESAVATRIAEEPAWREAYEQLNAGMAAVGAELGRLAPEPMPADLAARLETTFNTPAAKPRPTAVPAVRVAETPQRARGVRARSGRRLRWATPIAIAAGVVAFAGFSLDYLAGRSNKSADKASSGFAAAPQDNSGEVAAGQVPIKILQSGSDYTTATLGSEPEAQPLMAPDAGSAPAGSVPSGAFSPPAPRAASSVPALKEAPNRASDAGDPLSRLRGQAELQACLNAIQAENSGGTIATQSVDYARFEGKPAVVVRFSATNGSWAWASGPSCGTPSGDADTLGSVPVR